MKLNKCGKKTTEYRFYVEIVAYITSWNQKHEVM